MIALLLAVAAAQDTTWRTLPPAAYVGDTVRIERTIPAPAGSTGRTQALDATDVLEPLGAPELRGRPGGLLVRHAVAVFAPGTHAFAMPPIEIVAPDGHVELVLGDTAIVRVLTVLPDTGDRLLPRGAAAPLARPLRRPERPIGVLAVVLVGLVAWGLARRRTAPRPAPPVPDVGDTDVPLMRWLAAGESRAVATLAADRLRARIAALVPEASRSVDTTACLAVVRREQPEWPVVEIAAVLTALDRSRFAPLSPTDAAELADRTEELLPLLRVEAEA